MSSCDRKLFNLNKLQTKQIAIETRKIFCAQTKEVGGKEREKEEGVYLPQVGQTIVQENIEEIGVSAKLEHVNYNYTKSRQTRLTTPTINATFFHTLKL